MRSIENELGFVLTQAHTRVFRSVNQALTPLDLHVRTYTVLSIACDGDGVTQRAIAAASASTRAGSSDWSTIWSSAAWWCAPRTRRPPQPTDHPDGRRARGLRACPPCE